MKTFMLFVFLIGSGALGLAQSEAEKLQVEKRIARCLINKSESVEINQVQFLNENAILIQKKHFLGSIQDQILLKRAQVFEYGNVLMILENRGRSGYAFFRIDFASQNGQMDINLFAEEHSFFATNGQLAPLYYCFASQ